MRALLTLTLFLTACGGGSAPAPEATPTPASDAPVAKAPEAAPKTAAPTPNSHDVQIVGFTHTVLVFAEATTLEDPRFTADLQAAEAKQWPASGIWLGCMPEVTKAMGGSHERWVATLSFNSKADAEGFAAANGITPLAIVQDTIEPCGD